MHKPIVAFAVILLLPFIIFAQNNVYQFSHATAPYAALSQGQKISLLNFPDITRDFKITLPFPFNVLDSTFNGCSVGDGGELYFPNSSATIMYNLAALGCRFKKKDNTSGVFAQTDGTAGSRIYKLEYRNMLPGNSTPTDFVNLQVWLYEGTNNIELRFGPSTNYNVNSYFNQRGAFIGVIKSDQSSSEAFTSYYLVGDSASPIFRVDKPALYDTYMKGNIAPNTIYKFSRDGSKLSTPESPAITKTLMNVYPNPSKAGIINVSVENTQHPVVITVTDLQGKAVISKQIAMGETHTTLETAGLAPGMYILIANDTNDIISRQKIVIE